MEELGFKSWCSISWKYALNHRAILSFGILESQLNETIPCRMTWGKRYWTPEVEQSKEKISEKNCSLRVTLLACFLPAQSFPALNIRASSQSMGLLMLQMLKTFTARYRSQWIYTFSFFSASKQKVLEHFLHSFADGPKEVGNQSPIQVSALIMHPCVGPLCFLALLTLSFTPAPWDPLLQ